jgi:flagellar biosynthesis anti-sigma factor FlgM
MRIDPNNRLRELGETVEQSGSRVLATSVRSVSGDDTAELSGDQARVQSLVEKVIQLPDIRQEKVAALGLAIQQGHYEVSPEQTAEAILAEMQIRSAA